MIRKSDFMTITLPLQPQDEAKLITIARPKGVTPDEVVREALDKILAEGADPVDAIKDENRSEMFANFASDDF
jgi:hypothetical protein